MIKPKLRQFIGATACSAVCAFIFSPTLSNAAIDEFGGPTPDQMSVGEVKNEMVSDSASG